MRRWLCLAVLVVAIGVVLVVAYEWRAATARWSIGETEARVAEALPNGSSAAEVRAFLDEEGLSYNELVVSPNSAVTTTLRESHVAIGTPVIMAFRRQENSFIGLGPRLIEIVFVLNDDGELDDYFVYGSDPIQ